MMRPTIGVKLTALAVGVVGTAGVAAAATVGRAPAPQVALQPASIESVVDRVPMDLPEIPGLGDLTNLGDLGSLPTVPAPTVPKLPALPPIPGAGSAPVDLAGTATAAVSQVAALLPDPAALQAAVLGCVSDLTALSPVPAPSLLDPLGLVSGLLGSLSGAPRLPDPAAVQAAVTGCVADVLGVVPDPTALASSLTTAFGGNLPAPVAALVAQLTGGVPSAPDPGQLVDLVTGLIGATGSPSGVLDQLTAVLESVVPAPIAGLVSFPLAIVDQVFSTLGL